MANPVLGITLHAVGGASSASSIVPAKFTRSWDWNVYWLIFATVSLVLLPCLGTWLLIPHPMAAIAATPRTTLLAVLALGFLYGFGSYAFGWAIRLIGFSQTYCISIGFSATLGTIMPPMLLGGPALDRLLHTALGLYVGAALVIGLAGMAAIGAAGVRKERASPAQATGVDERPQHLRVRNARLGLALALGSGALSAAYGLALRSGAPLADAAEGRGANPLIKITIVFLFANGGAFLSTLLILVPLIWQKRIGHQFVTGSPRLLARNYGLGILGGAAWYLQFFFFGMAEHFMGVFSAASWALHMILLIIFAQSWGVFFAEWRGIDRAARFRLRLGLVLLVVAVLAVGFGDVSQTG